jgi:hypothetical protein
MSTNFSASLQTACNNYLSDLILFYSDIWFRFFISVLSRRIAVAKAAFNKKRALFTSTLELELNDCLVIIICFRLII